MKMQTTWDLKQLYSSAHDPKLADYVKKIEKGYKTFEKKYKDETNYLRSSKHLLKALVDYEKLHEFKDPNLYLFLLKDFQADNKEGEAMSNKVSQLLTKASNGILFFGLKLGKIPKEAQAKFLKDPTLKHFHYFLHTLFASSKHDLSEEQEKIFRLLALPAFSMWVEGQEKLLNAQVLTFKGKDMPITQALEQVKDFPTEERRALWNLIVERLDSISAFAESEINAIVTERKISDELRGFKKPYSSKILHYQNDEKSIENLVVTVTKAFPISHRFYKIKKQMLGLDIMLYADRIADVGHTKKTFVFDDALDIVRKAFLKLNPYYAHTLDSYLEKGQIDVFPRIGKRSGGYCVPTVNNPVFVLLNHTNDFHSVTTLAHEMGHAFHTELSRVQTPIYQGHSTAVAEVASTFFENFVFEEVFTSLSEEEKMVALHDKIANDVSCIFRQIALFNFENELHLTIRSKGSMSKEDIASLLAHHMRTYCGKEVSINDKDGYSFVYWSHIRDSFYVYSYAYGQIISRALYKKYKEDPSYLSKIEEFLKAGGSKSPEQIFKDIGIDTTKPSFFESGLKSIEEDVIRLEKMVKSATTKK